MKLKSLLVESFRVAREKFLSDEYAVEHDVDVYLNKFKELASKNVIKGRERDITHWIPQGWGQFQDFVDETEDSFVMSNRERKKLAKKDSSITVHETKTHRFIVPLTHEASRLYGAGTKWCTSAKCRDHFDEYSIENGTILLYALPRSGDEKIAMVVKYDYGEKKFYVIQMYEATDAEIDDAEWDYTLPSTSQGLDDYVDRILKPHTERLTFQ